MPAPKLDSSPQIPVTTPGSTPNRSCTRAGNALVGDEQRAVLRPGHGELGLMPIALEHLLVRLNPGERPLQRRGGNSGAPCLRAQAGEQALETIPRRARPPRD